MRLVIIVNADAETKPASHRRLRCARRSFLNSSPKENP